MRELGVVIARVPTVLRPQIQEAASAPQLVAGRLLQGESRLHAGRESTAPTHHFHGSSCVGARLMGTRQTLTLPSWISAMLRDPDSCPAAAAWEEEGGKSGQQEDAGHLKTPR